MATFYDNLRASGFLPTRGDIQKARRTRKIEYGSEDTSTRENPSQEGTIGVSNTPKAPSFTYKDPTNDENIALWEGFADDGTMRHYDELMYILDEADTLDTLDDARKYMKQLKNTTLYKILPGVQNWVNDFESMYYHSQDGGLGPYELSYPVALMRRQTQKAKEEYDNGYRGAPFYRDGFRKVPSPSKLLPKIKDSYK